MTHKIVTFAFLQLCLSINCYAQDIKKITYECSVNGLGIDGKQNNNNFIEKFSYESRDSFSPSTDPSKDKKINKYTVYSYRFSSNNIKYEIANGHKGDGFLLFHTPSIIGDKFNQKLLLFNHFIDLSNGAMTRIITKIPNGTEERSEYSCKKLD